MLFCPCFCLEISATGFNYQNEDEKVTLSFPSVLQKGKHHSTPLLTRLCYSHANSHYVISCYRRSFSRRKDG